MVREYSPFTPGIPVAPESFAGKADEVESLMASCRAAKAGRFERTFVLGERGIGKSSLCNLVRQLADRKLDMLAVHVLLGGTKTVEEMCRRVIEATAKISADRPWYDRLTGKLGDRIKQVGLYGVSISFEPSRRDMEHIANNFPLELAGLLDTIGHDRKGLLLVLDDINGLAESPKFANWLKSFVDTVATRGTPLPLHLVLCGLPDRRDALVASQPSLNRVFQLLHTELIADRDAERFFVDAFGSVGVKIDPDALRLLVDYAGGYPALLQEIGDATFKAASTDRVTVSHALGGAVDAAIIVGDKYLDRNILQAMRSEKYQSILTKLAREWQKEEFTRKEVSAILTDSEVKAFDNFVRKMKQLNVIDSPTQGTYRFRHRLHRLYFALKAGMPAGSREG
jgi:hypothetical protein